MADEEIQTQEQSGEVAESEVAGNAAEQTEDFEAKYKALQGESQKKDEELQRMRETYDMVAPAIDWSKLQGEEQEEQTEERPVTKQDLQKLNLVVDNKLSLIDFRQKHPEMREYEDTLIAPAVRRLMNQHPRTPVPKLMEQAAQWAQEFLDTERSKGAEKVAGRKKAAAGSGGLGAAATSSPAKGEEEDKGETAQEYVARRRKESAKARGLI